MVRVVRECCSSALLVACWCVLLARVVAASCLRVRCLRVVDVCWWCAPLVRVEGVCRWCVLLVRVGGVLLLRCHVVVVVASSVRCVVPCCALRVCVCSVVLVFACGGRVVRVLRFCCVCNAFVIVRAGLVVRVCVCWSAVVRLCVRACVCVDLCVLLCVLV